MTPAPSFVTTFFSVTPPKTSILNPQKWRLGPVGCPFQTADFQLQFACFQSCNYFKVQFAQIFHASGAGIAEGGLVPQQNLDTLEVKIINH